MSYSHSQIDKSNSKWFSNDNTRRSLVGIKLAKGKIRGLTPFEIDIKYPITAISGSNGSGKSTILCMAACAYHNNKSGYKPSLRLKSYYTYSDFFIQSSKEVNINDISIYYTFLHDKWKGSPPGAGTQSRKKPKDGKWNDYKRRIHRNVIYFGIQRVVPHYERSVHKSYRLKFQPGTMDATLRSEIATIASRIIGKNYTDFDTYEHSKYTLPVTTHSGITYSGFNMGAGEGSVFEILTGLFSAGDGTLIVIDEIELGLHESAQVRLIEELKKICLSKKCQIICSTHSHAVLRSLPPEARFHVENKAEKTFVTKGTSADFACSKMGKPDAHELDIFVEDDIALEILQSALPADIRKRSRIKSIGSHAAVVRQLASRKLEDVHTCICILDGDQISKSSDARSTAQKACECSTDAEKKKLDNWINERLFYLPGDEWPERWVVERLHEIASNNENEDGDRLVEMWGLEDRSTLIEFIESAKEVERHKEFYELGSAIDMSIDKIKIDSIAIVTKNFPSAFSDLIDNIRSKLP